MDGLESSTGVYGKLSLVILSISQAPQDQLILVMSDGQVCWSWLQPIVHMYSMPPFCDQADWMFSCMYHLLMFMGDLIS